MAGKGGLCPKCKESVTVPEKMPEKKDGSEMQEEAST
jgi:hypothetical protein